MSMYFSRLTLNDKNLFNQLRGNSYSEHQILWPLFEADPKAQRDFLYHKIENACQLQYYMLSTRKPEVSSPAWHVEGPKLYNPFIQKGQKFSFLLRANPSVALSRSKKRIDVVSYEKIKIKYKTLPRAQKPSLYQLVQKSCIHWLEKRAPQNGFDFEHDKVQAEAYTKHTARKHSNPIFYYTVDFSGQLQVTDVEVFKKTLLQGLGRGRAFGCGLLLIKRVL